MLAACPACGAQLTATDATCPRCGKEVSTRQGTPPAAVKSAVPRIAAILIAGIILGAVLGAAAVSVALTPPAPALPTKPAAGFAASTAMPFGSRIQLAGISSNLPVGDFYLQLRTAQSSSRPVRIPDNVTTGSYALVNVRDSYCAIFYRDRNPAGVLDMYDEFLVSPMHGTPCPTERAWLALLWEEESLIAGDGGLDWSCNAAANLTFGPASPMGNTANGTTVSITSAADEVLPMNLMARLQFGSALSYPVWMAMGNGTGIMMSGSMVSYNIDWEDMDRSGTVDAGDRFTVGMSLMMSSGIHMTLYILGRNGSPAGSVSWTT